MRSLVALIITLAITVVGGYAIASAMLRNALFYPERFPAGDWSTHRLVVTPQDHYFQASDGTKLHGWFFPSRDPAAPLMIWFHGNGGNITNRGGIAAELANRGTAVFVFDYRGFGRSEGSPTEFALYDDSLSAFDFAQRTFRPAAIAVYGESVGGPYAAHAAANRRTCAAIMDNTFPSLSAEINAIYSPFPVGFLFPRRMTTLRDLNRAGVPTLVVHGRQDRIVPFALGEHLFRGLQGEKQMFVSEQAGHSEVPFIEGDRYFDAVGSFVKRYCTPTSRTGSAR